MIKYSKRKFYNMTHTINPLADRRIPGILRLFYFVFNTLSTLWLLYYIQTMVPLGPIENVFAFVVLSLVYTLLSVGLSVYVVAKLFDYSNEIEMGFSWKVFVPVLVAQTTLILCREFLGNNPQSILIGLVAGLLVYYSAVSIKIDFHTKADSDEPPRFAD